MFAFLDEKYGCKEVSISKFTSYQVIRNFDQRTITLHQEQYIRELLAFTSMENSIPLSAPPTVINFLSKDDCP